MLYQRFRSYYYLLASVCVFSVLEGYSLDYATAVARVIQHSTALKASEMEMGAKEAELYQSRLYHNPEFSIEYDHNDKDSKAELTYSFTQIVEWAGKHCLEKKKAALESCIAQWDYEIQKQDKILELTYAFIDATVAFEKLNLAQEHCSVADEWLQCDQERHKQGKISSLEQKKSTFDACCKTLAASKAKTAYEATKRKIASLCHLSPSDFDTVSFPLEATFPLPSFQLLVDSLPLNPEFSKGKLERLLAETFSEIEEVNQYPNFEISAGVSAEHGYRSPSVFFALSFPLPVCDRNEGNLSKAIFREWQALYLQETTLSTLHTALQNAYSSWQNAYETLQMLEKEVHFSAKEQMKNMQEGYEKGKFEKYPLLEMQKTYLEVKDQHIEALADYHRAKANTLRLVGDQSGITR